MTKVFFSADDMIRAGAMAERATAAHFGINLVAHALPAGLNRFEGSAFADAVAGLNAGSIRYPGGTVTEQLFDPADENATERNGTRMLAQSEAIAFAARTGATLDLVLQTRSGFDGSAAAALLDGTYGQRGISAAYLDRTHDYVVRSLTDAAAAGVRVATIEIGNEFYYGGEMTASEYGRLTRDVLKVAQAAIDAVLPPGAEDPLLLVQSLNAAGRYSPRADTKAWVSGDQVSFDPVSGWKSVVIQGQGSAADQARAIADQITGALSGKPDLSGLVDGLIGHDYNARGHRADGSQPDPYLFSQFDRQEARLGFAPGALSRHITEWNARAMLEGSDGGSDGGGNDPVAALNRGLPHAALLVEMFYAFLGHGVDAADIWPVYFAASNTTNLLAFADYSQRLPGAAFGLMQESLIGLGPAFASHDRGAGFDLDTFGFAGGSRMVLFVSSRLDAETGPVTLDVAPAVRGGTADMLADRDYFIARTELSAIESNGQPTDGILAEASPVLGHGDGHMARGSAISVDDLGRYGTLRIEVTFVGNSADRVEGRGGNDQIRGLGGNDTLIGNAGNDSLYGNAGNDRLDGGAGHDSLDGGAGQDSLLGGLHDDWLAGGNGDDELSGGSGHDMLTGSFGNDRLRGDDGDDRLGGGSGRDSLAGGEGNDVLTGGAGPDCFVFENGFGTDRITDFRASAADRIDLSGLTGPDDVTGMAALRPHMAVVGRDMMISFGTDVIVVEGAGGHSFSSADFLF